MTYEEILIKLKEAKPISERRYQAAINVFNKRMEKAKIEAMRQSKENRIKSSSIIINR